MVAEGKLQLLGITQEQHPDRCALFAQWKGFTFPILHDPINITKPIAVPIVTAIDEHGIVRHTKPTKDWVRNEFATSVQRAASTSRPTQPDLKALRAAAQNNSTAEAWRHLGDARTLWSEDVSGAIEAYQRALQLDGTPTHEFRLGVALRRRHDSKDRRGDDFANAVAHWTTALHQQPNQYIWRRRIQQYGPRLDKPYPFYDWIDSAVKEIRDRGETPVRVAVPLSGAEIALPSKTFVVAKSQVSPDPEGKIWRDKKQFARINVAVVPNRIRAGENVRLHLEFQPSKQASWNNESDPLLVWLEPQEHWKPERSLIAFDNPPKQAESAETRRIEVELRSDKQAKSATIKGYAVYYVCDKASGACLYRRQDLAFRVNVAE